MLWMKAWFEIRWRAVIALALALLPILLMQQEGNVVRRPGIHVLDTMTVLWLLCGFQLAGTGVKTQQALRAKRGLHASTHFTLGLPVTRFRLLSVRAGAGLLATFGIIMVSSTLVRMSFPTVWAGAPLSDFVRCVFTAGCCAAAVYAIYVLASTVFDELWIMQGSVVIFFLLQLLIRRLPLPASWSPSRLVTDLSPLATHAVPWTLVAASLGLAGALFAIAVKVVETREY